MKNKTLLNTLLVLIIFYNCSSNSDENPNPDIQLTCNNSSLTTDSFFNINGDVELLEFSNIGYTDLTGKLTIRNVTDLSTLICLQSVRSLELRNCTFNSLEGLNNLSNVEELKIQYCAEFSNFVGIGNIPKLEIFEIRNNFNLINFQGFSSLNSISSMQIEDNGNLKNFNGLENLTTNHSDPIGGNGSFLIGYNPKLKSLSGMDNFSNILVSPLLIEHCPLLTNFGDFSQISEAAVIRVTNCASFTTLQGFNNLTNLGALNIASCNSFESLSFPSLISLGNLDIQDNPNLNSISGLSTLNNSSASSRDVNIQLSNNPNLKNLDGLENIVSKNNQRVSINTTFGTNDLNNVCALNLLISTFIADGSPSERVISINTECAYAGTLIRDFNSNCNCN